MNSSTRSISNYYWSWRKYLKEQLSSYKRYYNPTSLPKPDNSIDSWIIFMTGEGNPKLFSRWRSQIFCVARDDERSQNMMTVINDVISILDSRPTIRNRSFALYDKNTSTGIGTVYIENLIQRNPQEYSTGVSSTLIDIYTRVKTARNAYATA